MVFGLPTSALGTLGTGALITAVVAGWSQVKGSLTRLSGLLVITANIEARPSIAFKSYC